MKINNVELDHSDVKDGMLIFATQNAAMNFMRQPLGDYVPAERVEEWYQGIMRALEEAKIAEHNWRVKFSQKYEVPYTFDLDSIRNTLAIQEGTSV